MSKIREQVIFEKGSKELVNYATTEAKKQIKELNKCLDTEHKELVLITNKLEEARSEIEDLQEDNYRLKEILSDFTIFALADRQNLEAELQEINRNSIKLSQEYLDSSVRFLASHLHEAGFKNEKELRKALDHYNEYSSPKKTSRKKTSKKKTTKKKVTRRK